jgi:hypothetical protein
VTSPTADEVYDQFKAVLRDTVDTWGDEPVLKFQAENGMADWSLNDEDHVLLSGFTKNQLAKLLCHIVIITYGAEARYIDDIENESMEALQEIENDTESSDEEKLWASELIENAALAQADGYRHCTALIHGWALAAITADEGETVDWDSIFKEKSGE